MCELEHHRSHKKEIHLFKKSWKFMGCCTIPISNPTNIIILRALEWQLQQDMI